MDVNPVTETPFWLIWGGPNSRNSSVGCERELLFTMMFELSRLSPSKFTPRARAAHGQFATLLVSNTQVKSRRRRKVAASERPSVYRIYLVTVWQEPGHTEPDDLGWRFNLTDPRTGKRYGFADPVTLFAALKRISTEDLLMKKTS
jgi:hypothetical protein